ncbi:hypothetical protein [Neobacillus kokaensis]|uniref:FAD/FMN-containing dehydrogenase n=1 Tax=Neobacillus kokaensis TaxID=2759023 RepID=A0ABQ3MX20_9BACI|nr:hypothetical protein [Neobacillus kokaensis]GHH96962.1 hypothetical protein AM1BK_05050 [Neobacillus kokaensis]
MKKLAVGVLSAALVLGAGTAVLAAGNNDSNVGLSFEKMLPFMQKMHPDFSKKDLQKMYKACHGEGGMMEGTNAKNMMNRF